MKNRTFEQFSAGCELSISDFELSDFKLSASETWLSFQSERINYD